MSADESSPTAPRPNIRAIAARAGVSSATVSLALRRHPRISPATCNLVLRVARELGYRPDPQVAKLMQHLRSRRPPGFQSTLAALTTIPAGQQLSYLRTMVQSARGAAEALGYKLIVLEVEDTPGRRADLQRILLSRGVEGLLLLPVKTARSFAELLDWSKFAVVATTNGVLQPQFHRVVPHQFGNTLELCEQLARRGYRRIGTVLRARHDLTARHGFSAAVIWQNTFGGTERVQSLIFEGEQPAELKRWFAAERPDAIITAGDADARAFADELGLRVPGRVGFASINKTTSSIFAGIEERPDEIGVTAVRLIASLLQHGEKGIPKVPAVTMITGEWMDGRSVRTARLEIDPVRPRSA